MRQIPEDVIDVDDDRVVVLTRFEVLGKGSGVKVVNAVGLS